MQYFDIKSVFTASLQDNMNSIWHILDGMMSSSFFDVMKSTFILNHINQLQLIAATYVRECISEYLFSVLFANISTQKKLDHMLI